MNVTKYMVMISIIVLTITGCENNEKQSINESKTTGSNVNSKVIKTENISKNKLIERKYYSPDNKNFIRESTDAIRDISNNYYTWNLYLNNSTQSINTRTTLEIEPNLISRGAIWINNKEVLIGGENIFNITTSLRKSIFSQDIKKEYQQINSYSINKHLSKVAYVITGDYNQKVIIYDVNKKTWASVFDKKYNYTQETFLNIIWDYNDNLYFNYADINEEKQMIYKIFKYNNQKDEIIEYANDAILLNTSYDNRFLTYIDMNNNNTKILDTINEKECTIPYSYKLCWKKSEHVFAYIEDQKPDYISIMKFDKDFVIVSNMFIGDYLNNNYNAENLRDEGDKLVFDSIKYTIMNGINNIEDCQTHVIY